MCFSTLRRGYGHRAIRCIPYMGYTPPVYDSFVNRRLKGQNRGCAGRSREAKKKLPAVTSNREFNVVPNGQT